MWTKEKLEEYIATGIEENSHLEYKAALALSKEEQKKKEISKDVAAFANSDGGTIIYGIKEFDDKDKSHRAEKLDPVNRTEFSKEWLENIITGNITPTINGLIITPVTINESKNLVIYIVEIPKSNTAHQSNDFKYYKRRNFKSEPMDDWEVKDVINRGNKPIIRITLYAYIDEKYIRNISVPEYLIQVVLKNIGNVGAKNIECFLEFDGSYSQHIMKPRPTTIDDRIQIPFNNLTKNMAKIDGEEVIISVHYTPLLPDVWRVFGEIKVRKEFFNLDIPIKCVIATEYGNFEKTFNLQEVIKETQDNLQSSKKK